MSTISTYGQYLHAQGHLADLRQRMDTLTEQIASGKRATSYGALGGADTWTDLNLRAESSHIAADQANISTLAARAQLAASTTTAMGDLARGIADQAAAVNRPSTASAGVVHDAARTALEQMGHYLNVEFEGRRLFAGADTTDAPVAANGPAALVAAVRTATDGLASGASAATVLAGVAAAADGTAAYSASFVAKGPPGGGMPGVPVGRRAPVGLPLDAGSPPVRGMLGALATLAALPDPATLSATQQEQWQTVADTAVATLRGSASDLDQATAVSADRAKQADEAGNRMDDELLANAKRLSGIEDADMADAASELALLRSQMEAAYKATVMMHDMSLVNYIS